jgi:hypothetical protein
MRSAQILFSGDVPLYRPSTALNHSLSEIAMASGAART